MKGSHNEFKSCWILSPPAFFTNWKGEFWYAFRDEAKIRKNWRNQFYDEAKFYLRKAGKDSPWMMKSPLGLARRKYKPICGVFYRGYIVIRPRKYNNVFKIIPS